MKGGTGTEGNRATDYDISNFFFHMSQQGKCVLLKTRFTKMLNQLAFSVFALMTGGGGDSQNIICIFNKVDFMLRAPGQAQKCSCLLPMLWDNMFLHVANPIIECTQIRC